MSLYEFFNPDMFKYVRVSKFSELLQSNDKKLAKSPFPSLLELYTHLAPEMSFRS